MRYRDFLKNPGFLFYNSGRVLSQIADRLFQVVLIAIVSRRFPGQAPELAKITFASILPAFLISPLAGVCVDRLNKRRLLWSMSLIRAVLVLVISLVALKGASFTPLYIAVFLVFTTSCVSLPAQLSIVPELIRTREILMANAMATGLWLVAAVAAFSGGAFAVEKSSTDTVLLSVFILYAAASAAFWFMRPGRAVQGKDTAAPPREKRTMAALMKEGFLFIARDRNARFLAELFFATMATGGALYTVTIVFIQGKTQSVTSGLGWIGLGGFAGFLIASYALGKLGGTVSRIRAMIIATGVCGIGVILFALTLSVNGLSWQSIGCTVLLGAALAPVATYASTLVHEAIPEEIRGRTFSLLGVIMNLAFSAFMFLTAYTATRIDPETILISCGALLTAVGIFGYIRDRKVDRNVISS